MPRPNGTLEEALAAVVEVLALPGEAALARRPEHERRPQRLAAEFDDAYTDYIEHLQDLPRESQLESLQVLDSAFNAMAGPQHTELWTEDAVKQHPRWEEIRGFALIVLAEYGWLTTH